MRPMRSAGLGLLLAAVVALPACNDKGGEATPAASASAPAANASADHAAAEKEKAAAEAKEKAAAAEKEKAEHAKSEADREKATEELHVHHRHHHHAGIPMFIHMAVESLGLPAEKKAQVEKIQAELHEKMAPAREAGRAVLELLADGVAAGKMDEAKLNAAIKKEEAAAGAVHAAEAEALNKLHAALTPGEREALVEKVKAHVAVWKKVNHEEEHGAKEKGTRLAHLTETLKLTPEQVEKISAALKKEAPPKAELKEIDAHVKAFEEAFVGEKFDAKALKTADAANSAIAKHGIARMVHFYKTITPLLTPEQRKQLAEQIKERLNDPHSAK